MRTLALTVCMLLAIGTARAGDDKATAKALYDEGLRHYNVAEYKEAITAWKQAYLISKKPLLLFNIAQAFRLSGDCTQALTFYDSYVRDESDITNQDELDQAVAECKTKVAGPAERGPDQAVKPAEPPKPVPPAPPPPQPARPVPSATSSGMRKIGIGVGSAGVVALGAGIYFALQSKRISDELGSYHGPWDQPHRDKASAGQRDATLGWVFGAGGLALALAGGTMYVLGGRSAEHVAIAPMRGGAAVAWGIRF